MVSFRFRFSSLWLPFGFVLPPFGLRWFPFSFLLASCCSPSVSLRLLWTPFDFRSPPAGVLLVSGWSRVGSVSVSIWFPLAPVGAPLVSFGFLVGFVLVPLGFPLVPSVSFWFRVGPHLVSLGFLLVPFWSHLASFASRLPPAGFLLVSFWHPSVQYWACVFCLFWRPSEALLLAHARGQLVCHFLMHFWSRPAAPGATTSATRAWYHPCAARPPKSSDGRAMKG